FFDSANHRVRKVDAVTGIITTAAGNGASGFSGDGGPATLASFSSQCFLAFDSAGNLYISDELNGRVRKVNQATGIVMTVAGNGTQGFTGDGGSATSAELYNPTGMAFDP